MRTSYTVLQNRYFTNGEKSGIITSETKKEIKTMEYFELNNGVRMPMEGLGTFLLSPKDAEESVYNACGTATV